ncbi:unnamed protein product [Trifolium pratense]|uniref:Uncharacterized protein n=1 Tax=Trifolium pratense TaxID=57577 RepID=A0ACB0K6C7_TRIPR|nr:unnamed protein product [Trifolium pratense]
MDRSWMYDRVNPNRFGLKDTFFSGVGMFVNKAMEQPQFLNHGEIRCPCVKCKCIDLKTPNEVKCHLYQFGFLPNYYIWTEHGEEDRDVHRGGHFSGGEEAGDEDVQLYLLFSSLQKAGCGTQGKPPISKKHSQVIPPGSLAIANNRMRQQKCTFRSPKSTHCNPERALYGPESTTD